MLTAFGAILTGSKDAAGNGATRDKLRTLIAARKLPGGDLLTVEAPGLTLHAAVSEEEKYPCIYRDAADGSWLMLFGQLGLLGLSQPLALAAVLKHVRVTGLEAYRRLTGNYVLLHYDAGASKLTVMPAYTALMPSFHRQLPDGTHAIASASFVLAALAPSRFNRFACQTLFRIGHPPLPQTIFQEVSYFAQGHAYEFAHDGVKVREFWRPGHGERNFKTIKDAAAAIGDALVASCQAEVDSSTQVRSDLTAGYDSRTSCTALRRAGIEFTATVTGPFDHPDVRVATMIAQAEKIPIEVVAATRIIGSDGDPAAAAVLGDGGMAAFRLSGMVASKQRLFSGGLGHNVVGTMGDFYRNHFWLQEFLNQGKKRPASLDNVIRYRMDSHSFLSPVFQDRWLDDWRRQVKEWLAEIAAPYRDGYNTLQLDAIQVRKLAGLVNSMGLASVGISHNVVPLGTLIAMEIGINVPPKWRFNAELQCAVMNYLDPGIASHMSQYGRPCQPMTLTNAHRFLPQYTREGKRLIRKLSGMVMTKPFFLEYAAPRPDRNEFAPFIAKEAAPGGHLDHASMRTGAFYHPARLKELVNDSARPDFGHNDVLSVIYTLEAAARHTGAVWPEAEQGPCAVAAVAV